MCQMLKEPFKFYDDENILFRETYNYLIEKWIMGNSINQNEYSFLCWLWYNNSAKFPSEINKPPIPKIIDLPEKNFKDMFCTNKERKDLYNDWFRNFLNQKINEFKVSYFDVLIGGSFVDMATEEPNDIDCAILVDKIIMDYIVAKDYYSYSPHKHIPVDAEYLINDWTYESYWKYSVLTNWGNKAADKRFQLRNNSFEKRDVFRIRLGDSKAVMSDF